jgi:ribosome-associated protein
MENTSLSGSDLAKKVADLALEKKAKDITILDLRGLSDFTDFFVIATSESDLQTKTIAAYVEQKLKDEEGLTAYNREGLNRLHWVLLDYVDVVMHIFREETREYYALERLWADAKVIKVEDDATNRNISV